MPIYTRTGDEGDTGLFGGGRVPKDHPRVSAYGEVDELNAVIGVAAACDPRAFYLDLLRSIQRDLFAIGGQLATPQPDKVSKALHKTRLPANPTARLEEAIDTVDAELPELRAFVLPGGSMKAAVLHQARTVCRRAERQVVALSGRESVAPEIVAYLNRLSDLLFTLARLANHRANVPDRIW